MYNDKHVTSKLSVEAKRSIEIKYTFYILCAMDPAVAISLSILANMWITRPHSTLSNGWLDATESLLLQRRIQCGTNQQYLRVLLDPPSLIPLERDFRS